MDFNLKNKNWKEFVIKDLFHVQIGKNIDGNKVNKHSGQVAYITRKESNNGIDGFINFDKEYLNTNRPVITIGNETAEPFVQNYEFFTGTKVNILTPQIKLSRLALSFIANCLKQHKSKYSYSFTINSTRLRQQRVLLPVDSQGNPDYAFMEAYMRQKEQEKLDKYKQFVKKRLLELQSHENVDELDSREWKGFYIGELFSLSQGKSKGLNHLMKVKDGINYLGATNLNNGVLTQVMQVKQLVHNGNAIAFIRNGEGSMGYSMYKAEDFIATSDISVGYSNFLNRYTGLFITTIADKVRGKYNFGYKRSDRRLKKEKIMLPIDHAGKPDYEFMENYMKKLEHQKLSRYLSLK